MYRHLVIHLDHAGYQCLSGTIPFRALIKSIRVILTKKEITMLDKPRSPPLAINIHIWDNKTDIEERVTTFNIRKVDVDLKLFRSYRAATEEKQKQQEGLDRKYKAIMNLVIWAMNNGKSLEVVNAIDDD